MTVQIPAGYKQTEVGVIPEDWIVSTLGELCSFENGDRSSNYPSGDDFSIAGVPFINAGHLEDGKILLSSMDYIKNEIFNKLTRGKVKKKDILYCIRGSLGKFGEVGELISQGAIASSLVIIRLKNKNAIHGYFKAFLSSSFCSKQIENWAGGAAQPNLGVQDLSRFLLAHPTNKLEQQAIAEALSDADALIESLEQLIAKKRQIKQGAMQDLLTGQRRLPGFSGEWLATRLGDVAEFFKGKGLPKSQITPDGSDACIHYGELFTHYPETINKIIGRTNGEKDSFRSLDNDVLMPTSDVTPRGLAKASCLRVNDVVLGGDILVIRSDKNKINGSFLSYLIRNNEDSVLQLVTGSTVFHLYGSDMKNFIFSMPSISEQNEIVSILSAIDAELNVLETRLSKASQIKQGMMQELLTGRIRLIKK